MLFRLAIQLKEKSLRLIKYKTTNKTDACINKHILVHSPSKKIIESYLEDLTKTGYCLYEIITTLEPNAMTVDILNEEKLEHITEDDTVISWDRYCYEYIVEEIKGKLK